MQTKKLFFLLASLFIAIGAQAQNQIFGSDLINEECCEWYSIRVPDTLNLPATWEFLDATGNVLDTKTTTNPHEIEICLEDYRTYAPPFLLKVSIPDLQWYAEKVIELAPIEPLQIFSDYSCIIQDSFGCAKVCVGAIANYAAENNNPNGLLWTVQGGTILQDDGWSITVLWDQVGQHFLVVEDLNSNCPQSASLCVEVLPVPIAEMVTTPSFDTNKELTICKGQNIYFENKNTGGGKVRWDFGNGYATSKDVVELTYDNPGEYDVVLYAEHGCECVDSTSITITVLDAISPELTCVGTTCPQESHTYYVINDCPETEWTVSANGTIVDGGGSSDDFITVEWTSGPYGEITILGKNCPPGYCPEPSVYRIPIISSNGPISGDASVCTGQIATYTAPFFQGTDYTWTASSGATVLDHGNDHTFTVQWSRVSAPNSNQWIEVQYDNCYLECGGQDRMDVKVLGRYEVQGDIVYCENETPSFESKPLGGTTNVSADWTLVDANGATLETRSALTQFQPSVALPPGNYVVIGEVNPDDYCNNVIEKEFEVMANPSPPVGILGENSVCKNANHQFDIDMLDPNYIVHWEIVDGSQTISLENQTTAYHTFISDGPYEVRAFYQDAASPFCASNKVTMQLNAYSFTIDGPMQSCEQEVTSYKCTSQKPSGFHWTINPPESGVIIGSQFDDEIEIFWATAGQHDVVLEHCGGQQIISVQVDALPLPKVNYPSELCEGASDIVSVSGNFSSITWKDENGSVIGNGANINLSAGYYSVELTDVNGCPAEDQFRIVERPAPDAVISFGDVRAFCDTEPFTPRILYANTDGDYHYQWFHEGLPVGADSPTLKATAFGAYTCEVTNKLGCSKMSNVLLLLLDCDDQSGRTCNGKCKKKTCPKGIDVDFDILDAGIYCNEKIFRNSTTVGDVLSHEWFFEDLRNGGWISETALEPSHVFRSAGYHMVIFDALVRPYSNPGVTCQDHIIKVVKIPLAAWFTADNECAGTPVSFLDLTTYIPGETINSYSWDFGDPMSGALNFSGDANPNHTYISPGKYQVKLTVEAASGCISDYTYEVEVYDAPVADFTLPSQICVGASLELTAPSGLKQIEWDFGQPSAAVNEATSEIVYHAYNQVGQYDITLNGKNIYGCEISVTKPINVVDVANKEQITVKGNLPLCQGETVFLEGPSAVKWFWSSGETSQQIAVTQAGKYSVQVVNADGCTYTTDEIEVTVNPKPSVTALATQLDENQNAISSSITRLEICDGDMASLTALGMAHWAYSWSNGRSGKEIMHPSWRGVGTYAYHVDVRDPATGCTTTSNVVEVVVHPVPSAPTIQSSPTGLLCENDLVTFSVQNPNSVYTYVWSNGQTGTSIQVSGAGDYSVTAYNSQGCGTESNAIRIYAAPNADIVMSGCLTRCDPDTICVPNIEGAWTYQWYKDGQIIPAPEGTIRDFVATESGVYQLEVTNFAGCSDISDPLELEVQPGYGDLTVTVYFDVNNNGIIDAGDIVLENIKVNVTEPGGSILTDLSDQLGQLKWFDKGIGTYSADVQNDTLELVPGIHETEIQGCGDPFDLQLLLRKKCPETVFQLDTSICVIDTLFVLDTFLVDTGLHTISRFNQDGCLEKTEVSLSHDAPNNELTVTVYFDVNDDGLIDGGDIVLENIKINVTDPGGTILSDLSNQFGQYKLFGLTNGNYSADVVSDTLELVPGIHDVDVEGCGDPFDLQILLRKKCPETLFQLDTTMCALDTLFVMDTFLVDAGDHVLFELNQDGCLETTEINISHTDPEHELTVTVYLDLNNNGVIDQGDREFPGIGVLLMDGGTETDRKLSGLDGQVFFSGQEEKMFTAIVDTASLPVDLKGIIISDNIVFDGCSGTYSVSLLIKKIDTQVFVPNVFTPNGDNQNDVFRVFTGNEDDWITYFAIYDRWGEKVFESNERNKPGEIGWDGTFLGERLNPSVFVYVVDVEHFNGEKAVLKGDVTLLY